MLVGLGCEVIQTGAFAKDFGLAGRDDFHAFTIQDVGGASMTVHSTAVVADAALAATGAIVRPVAGAPFRGVVASFTDADPNGTAADFSGTISWGDGTTSAGTIAANGRGGFTVSASTTYAASGFYTVHVTISDAGGAKTAIDTGAAVTSLNHRVEHGLTGGTGFCRLSS